MKKSIKITNSRHNNFTIDDWKKQRASVERLYFAKQSKKIELFMSISKKFPVKYFDALGRKNLLNCRINEYDFTFDNLPDAFHDFTILHLSDIHFGADDRQFDSLIATISKCPAYDAVVLSGDYYFSYGDMPKNLQEKLFDLIAFFKVPVFIILGNHDRYHIYDDINNLSLNNVYMGVNEYFTLSIDEQKIFLYCADEYTYRDIWSSAHMNVDDFGIAVVHTPNPINAFAINNWDLYLCGHCHGGQIRLPNNKPIILPIEYNKEFAKGTWNYKNMQGFTSEGCGASGIAWRFFSPPEISLHRLKKQK